MKKIMLMIISFILIISLVSCNNTANDKEMKLTATQLTKEESDVLNLLGYNSNYKIYDYALNNKAKSIKMKFYTLDVNGIWVENGEFSSADVALNGRISISTFGETENLRISYLDEYGVSVWTSDSEVYKNLEAMSRTITWAEGADIVYNQEIPLAIQILTNSDRISSYGVDNFKDSEKFKGHDVVNAVTITFYEKLID